MYDKLIPGTYALYGYVTDSSGRNSIVVSNTILLEANTPIATLSASGSTVYVGQSVTYNALIAGGFGPYTVNLVYANNGVVASTVISQYPGRIAFSPLILPLGSYSFNVIGVDNGQVPAVSFASTPLSLTVVNALSVPSAPSLTANNLDVGQPLQLSTTVFNGLPPYTYDFIISSALTNTVLLSGNGGSTQTFNLLDPGTYHANVMVTDSLPTSVNSVYSQTFTVGATPTAASLTPSNSLISSGQGVAFNVLVSGGIGPFTLQLVASNGVAVNTITGVPAGIITFNTIFPPVGKETYNVMGTDTGTTPRLPFNSTSNSITVTIPSLTTTIPQSSNPGGPEAPAGEQGALEAA